MTLSVLEKNLSILETQYPALCGCVRRYLGSAQDRVPRSIPGGAPLQGDSLLEECRATTCIYFGTDKRLVGYLAALTGEVNLVVVIEDMGAFCSLLARVDHPNLFDPRRVRWIYTEDQVESLRAEDYYLGVVKLLNPDAGGPSSLRLSLLKGVKSFYANLAERRELNPATYLVMITHNRLACTILTLKRLAVNTDVPFKLVIIDNQSEDGTPEWLETNRAEYKFIERIMYMNRNLGVGRALNNGMVYALSRSRRVGRLDNDILVPPFWLRDLNAVLDSPMKPWVVGGFVTEGGSYMMHVRNATPGLLGDLKVYLVDMVGGGCNVYNPLVFERLGYFPEDPLYGVEDGGLCRAVREAGYVVVIVDNVKVEHLQTIMPDSRQYRDFKGSIYRQLVEKAEDRKG